MMPFLLEPACSYSAGWGLDRQVPRIARSDAAICGIPPKPFVKLRPSQRILRASFHGGTFCVLLEFQVAVWFHVTPERLCSAQRVVTAMVSRKVLRQMDMQSGSQAAACAACRGAGDLHESTVLYFRVVILSLKGPLVEGGT